MEVIEESTAAYASPVVMVEKPDGSTRVCVDYWRLNRVTIFDPEPMPTVKVKGKVFPYSLPSVGPGADPGVQAVSPQVT